VNLLEPAPIIVHGLGAFNIVIVPDATLAANLPALVAFQRGAQQWANRINDPILVTVNASLAPLPAGVIGSTGTVALQAGYNTIRNQLVADSVGNPNKTIINSLPTAAGFSAFVPSGGSLSGSITGSKANLKAMGFTGLDANFGVSDGNITFSTNFAFDFDNSNGVTAGQMDFETVAAHEIGHLLGFTSNVDAFDSGTITGQNIDVLDLYRFKNVVGSKPTSAATFTTSFRALVPNDDEITSDSVSENRMSTGVALGDGRQASHWKADELTGNFIGIMDPTLALGQVELTTNADFRAMELIGYEVVVPEPGTVSVLVFGGLTLTLRRRRNRA
jgi:hypothetical protein